MNCDNFFVQYFDPKMCLDPQAQKYPRGNMFQYPKCILLLPNVMKFIRVNFASLNKKHLKVIKDIINDKLNIYNGIWKLYMPLIVISISSLNLRIGKKT